MYTFRAAVNGVLFTRTSLIRASLNINIDRNKGRKGGQGKGKMMESKAAIPYALGGKHNVGLTLHRDMHR